MVGSSAAAGMPGKLVFGPALRPAFRGLLVLWRSEGDRDLIHSPGL